MPRDGSAIYNIPPGTLAAPETTIQSAEYNAFVNDIAMDLNHPRPVVAGGTGGANAIDAMTNLNGEISDQIIVNFDSDPMYSGSFYSAATATNPPMPGHAFAGWIYKTDDDNMVIEARDHDDTSVPGLLYVREKKGATGAGVWGAWTIETAVIDAALDALDAAKVDRAGDTMTGNLIINGVLNVNGTIQTATTPTTGVYYFGTSGIPYLQFDGTRFIFNGGDIVASGNNITATGAFIGSGPNCILASVTAGGVFLRPNGSANTTSQFVVAGGTASISGAMQANTYNLANGVNGGYHCKTGDSNVTEGYYFNLNYSSPNLSAYANNTFLGNVTFASDYRIKKDVIDLPGMWDTVKALHPIKYTHQDFTPAGFVAPEDHDGSHFVQGNDIEQWGFLAHELQETMIPSAATGVKDQDNCIQSPNPFTLLAAVVKALQEAQSRIEALENALKKQEA